MRAAFVAGHPLGKLLARLRQLYSAGPALTRCMLLAGPRAAGYSSRVPTPIAWSRRAADELWSGVVTPLTFSVLAEQMAEHMVRHRLRQGGLAALGDRPVFRLLRGHVYVNASLIHDVMREVPSAFLSEGVLALVPEELRQDLRAEGRALWDPRTVLTVLRLTWNERQWTPWARAGLFRAEAARVAREFQDFDVVSSASPEEVVAGLEGVRERLGSFLEVVSWAMIYAYLFFHLAEHLMRGWLPEGEALAVIAAGVSGVRTFEVHEEVAALAGRVRSNPALREALADPDPGRVVVRMERGELGAFGEDFLDLRRRHGHRLIARDLSFPTWAEKPEVLVGMIRRLASSPSSPLRNDPREALRRTRAEVARGPLGFVRSRVFDWGLGWCREYYAVRENMRYHADYFLAALRKLARVGATRLVERGILRSVDDVFYLTVDELGASLRGGSAAPEVGGLAEGRRRDYDGYRRSAPPEVVWGDAAEVPGEECPPSGGRSPGEEPGARRAWRALAASPGAAAGPARVVFSAEELEAMEPGEILVAVATDPTWTSYLSLAAGLVLEVGGLLSHGAIVARELGIPAVVDLGGATRLIRTGDPVRLDGSSGTVERLGADEPSA